MSDLKGTVAEVWGVDGSSISWKPEPVGRGSMVEVVVVFMIVGAFGRWFERVCFRFRASKTDSIASVGYSSAVRTTISSRTEDFRISPL